MRSKYYNGVRLLNAKCPINFSIGNRSAGKSYYWKRYCIKRFIKYGEHFIYLRRYVNDVDLAMGSFFDDIGHEFKEYSFVREGNCCYLIKLNETGEVASKELCGFCFALSILHKLKSMPFDNVNTIFYDEFIPENLRYLKPLEPTYEPSLLLSLYLTVARGYNRVIRDEVRIICVANMVTMYNPYFSFFEIDLTNQDHIIKNNVYAEKIMQSEIAQEIRDSKIGAILTRTTYGSYALDNIAYNDNESHVKARPRNAKPYFALYAFSWYMCYFDDYGNVYFDKGYDESIPRKYKLCNIDDSNDAIPWFKGDIVKVMKNLIESDKIYYCSMEIKSRLAGYFTPRI